MVQFLCLSKDGQWAKSTYRMNCYGSSAIDSAAHNVQSQSCRSGVQENNLGLCSSPSMAAGRDTGLSCQIVMVIMKGFLAPSRYCALGGCIFIAFFHGRLSKSVTANNKKAEI